MKYILIILALITLSACSSKFDATSGMVKITCTDQNDSNSSEEFIIDLDQRRANFINSDYPLESNAYFWKFTVTGFGLPTHYVITKENKAFTKQIDFGDPVANDKVRISGFCK